MGRARQLAFSLVELVVVLALAVVLAGIFVPVLASTRGNSQNIVCRANLKQMGVALHLWENDHLGKFPTQLSTYSGGAAQYLAHGNGTATPFLFGANCPGFAFLILSNYLGAPETCYCPADDIHTAGYGYATNFTFEDFLGIPTPAAGSAPATQVGENPGAGNSKVSYFINADAGEAGPPDIFCGDDNLGNQTTSATSFSTHRFGVSSAALTETLGTASSSTFAGIVSTAWSGPGWWSWTANNFHPGGGNLLMMDGSSSWATVQGLHDYLNHSTNTLYGEAINFMP